MRSITAAVVAAALVVASVPPAEALGNNGLSSKQAKQVRTIVKQEVAKIPRGPREPAGPQGPTGPAGPAGMDGMAFLFAHVFDDGGVHGNGTFGGGISEDNVRRVARDIEEGGEVVRVETKYCFVGLPPLNRGQGFPPFNGGQVTVFGTSEFAEKLDPVLHVEGTADFDPECPTEVIILNQEGHRVHASFYILLY